LNVITCASVVVLEFVDKYRTLNMSSVKSVSAAEVIIYYNIKLYQFLFHYFPNPLIIGHNYERKKKINN